MPRTTLNRPLTTGYSRTKPTTQRKTRSNCYLIRRVLQAKIGIRKLEDPLEGRPQKDQPRPQQIAISKAQYTNNLVVQVQIGKASTRALINSGCIGNFISPAFVKQHDIRTYTKKEPFLLIGFDRKPITYNNSIISQETQQLPLLIGRYIEITQFNITNTPGYDVVLGLQQLIESNLTINQSSKTIQFRNS